MMPSRPTLLLSKPVDPSPSQVIATRIRNTAVDQGITTRAMLARLAGCSPRKANVLWTGRGRLLVQDIAMVARVLGVAPSEFFRDKAV